MASFISASDGSDPPPQPVSPNAETVIKARYFKRKHIFSSYPSRIAGTPRATHSSGISILACRIRIVYSNRTVRPAAISVTSAHMTYGAAVRVSLFEIWPLPLHDNLQLTTVLRGAQHRGFGERAEAVGVELPAGCTRSMYKCRRVSLRATFPRW